MEQQCMNPNRSSVCLSSNSRTFMNIRMSDHSWTLEWAIRGNRRRPMTPPSENRGGQCTNEGVGEGKNNFFCVFLKKKFVLYVNVMRISYLCIWKKFSKKVNFWGDEKKKVSRFEKLFEREQNEKQLKDSRLETSRWRIGWTTKDKKLSRSEKKWSKKVKRNGEGGEAPNGQNE